MTTKTTPMPENLKDMINNVAAKKGMTHPLWGSGHLEGAIFMWSQLAPMIKELLLAMEEEGHKPEHASTCTSCQALAKMWEMLNDK